VKCAIGEIVIPTQRKRTFTEEKARELAESIKEIGLLQPIIVTKDRVLVSGLHRLEEALELRRQSPRDGE